MIIKKYEDLEKVSEELLSGKVVVDLSKCDNDLRMRAIDFMAGLTINDGSIRKVKANVFELEKKNIKYQNKLNSTLIMLEKLFKELDENNSKSIEEKKKAIKHIYINDGYDPDSYAHEYFGGSIVCNCDGLLSITKILNYEDYDKVIEVYKHYRKIPIIFFPSEPKGINPSRATIFEDRIDLTLYDLKMYFIDKSKCKLIESYEGEKTSKWLEELGSFEKYVDTLNLKGTFVDNEYNVINIETGKIVCEKDLNSSYNKVYYERLKDMIDKYMENNRIV